MSFQFSHPYLTSLRYEKPVAYFCMEFAVHQALKIYAGGLGYLAGSFMRSAFELKQNVVGVGILWKYGYYDQTRMADGTMDVQFKEKNYYFLQYTHIKYTVRVAGHDVWVTAYYLSPEIFKTAPEEYRKIRTVKLLKFEQLCRTKQQKEVVGNTMQPSRKMS